MKQSDLTLKNSGTMHKFNIREKGSSLREASKALIIVHGRGATAENILPLADYFTDESWYIAAPQATGLQWYPYSFMAPSDKNEPWLGSAIDYMRKIIEDISEYIDYQDIYLMGFSQGACLSAEVTARYALGYGGLAVFTGGLIGEVLNAENYSGHFEGTRIYMSNGDDDPHIPVGRSAETRDQLISMGADVKMDIFPGREHTIIQEEIDNAYNFLFLSDKQENSL